MNIVVLDGYGMNPGDLEWDALHALGNVTVHDRTAPGDILERAAEADAVLTNKTPLDAATLRALPRLRYVGVLATGYNVVDVAAARELGITVTNIPAYSTASVAQMAFAHLLAVTNRVEHYTEANRAGRWAAGPDFCWWDTQLTELAGKRMGIVGLGSIGSAVARIAQAFGMEVAAFTSKPQADLPAGVVKMPLDELFATSDVVSLHCPLTPHTHHLADERRLALMKPGAILINTGRGPLVDAGALARALAAGHLRAACVDVMTTEPPAPSDALLAQERCFSTPHLGWATLEARRRLMHIAAENLRAFIDNNPINVVS
ncbi:MAG: D-2-hydroxyacid dehydrogenase [Muribaculaceae bacterium]|nr:D-2-hydroxyacid dehydrogenase [Muribaculaceae bacterium]